MSFMSPDPVDLTPLESGELWKDELDAKHEFMATFNSMVADMDFELGIPKVKVLMEYINDDELMVLLLFLAMQHPVSDELSHDVRLQLYIELDSCRFNRLARTTGCCRLAKMIETYTPEYRDQLPMMLQLSHWLGLFVFHLNTPFLTDELDWIKVLDSAETKDTLSDIIMVTLQFIKLAATASSPVFTAASAWVNVVYTRLKGYSTASSANVTLSTKMALIECLSVLELSVLKPVRSIVFFKYKCPTDEMKAHLDRVEATCRDLYHLAKDNPWSDLIPFKETTLKRMKAHMLVIIREAVVKKSINAVTTVLTQQAPFLRKVVLECTEAHEIQSAAMSMYKMVAHALHDFFFSQDYFMSFVQTLSRCFSSVLWELKPQNGGRSILDAAEIQRTVTRYATDNKFLIMNVACQIACEVCSVTVDNYLHQIMSKGRSDPPLRPYLHMPTTVASLERRLFDMLRKYMDDIRILTPMVEGVEEEPMISVVRGVINNVCCYIKGAKNQEWQDLLSEICGEYVAYYSRTKNGTRIEVINLQHVYRRTINYLLLVFGRRFTKADISVAVSKGVLTAVLQTNISITALKDLLHNKHVSSEIFDEHFREELYEIVNQAPNKPEALYKFAENYTDFGLGMMLPLTGEFLTCIGVSQYVTVFKPEMLQRFRSYAMDVFFAWVHLSTGQGANNHAPEQLISEVLIEFGLFNYTDGAYFLSELVYSYALYYFPFPRPEEPDFDVDNCTRLWIADGWGMLIGYLVKLYSGPSHSRARFMKRLISVVFDRLYESPEVVGIFRLHVRALVTVLRSLMNDAEGIPEKTMMFHVFLNGLFEIQPLIIPSFAMHWLTLITDPFIMEVAMDFEDEEVTIRYVQCFMTGFTLIQDVYESCADDGPIIQFISGMKKSIIVLVTGNPTFFCKHYYRFVPFLPIYFQYIRHVLLMAVDEGPLHPDTPFLGLTMFLRLSDSRMHPDCHDKEFSDFPRTFRELLNTIPQCTEFKEIGLKIVNYFRLKPTAYSLYNLASMYGFTISMISAAVNYFVRNDLEFSVHNVQSSAYYRVFVEVSNGLCNRGTLYLIHFLLDQLRFPNTHTSFVLCLVPCLFATNDNLREYISAALFRQMSMPGPNRVGISVLYSELCIHWGLLDSDAMKESIVQNLSSVQRLAPMVEHVRYREATFRELIK